MSTKEKKIYILRQEIWLGELVGEFLLQRKRISDKNIFSDKGSTKGVVKIPMHKEYNEALIGDTDLNKKNKLDDLIELPY